MKTAILYLHFSKDGHGFMTTPPTTSVYKANMSSNDSTNNKSFRTTLSSILLAMVVALFFVGCSSAPEISYKQQLAQQLYPEWAEWRGRHCTTDKQIIHQQVAFRCDDENIYFQAIKFDSQNQNAINDEVAPEPWIKKHRPNAQLDGGNKDSTTYSNLGKSDGGETYEPITVKQ